MQRTVSATYYRYYLRFCINVIQSKKEFYQKSNSNQKEVIQIKIAIKKRSYILKYATCIYILQIVINTRLQDAY